MNSKDIESSVLHMQGQITAQTAAVSMVLAFLANKNDKDAETLKELLTSCFKHIGADACTEHKSIQDGFNVQSQMILDNLDAATTPL